MWKNMSSTVNERSPYMYNKGIEDEKQPNNSNNQLQQLFEEM